MRKTRETALSSIHEYKIHRQNTIRRRHSNSETDQHQETEITISPQTSEVEQETEAEVIWIRRDEVYPELSKPKPMPFEIEDNSDISNTQLRSKDTFKPRYQKKRKVGTRRTVTATDKQNNDQSASNVKGNNVASDIYARKMIVAEWQRIAAVIDRVLFWIYLIGTIASYLVILIVVPKSNYDRWNSEIKHLPEVRSDSRYTM